MSKNRTPLIIGGIVVVVIVAAVAAFLLTGDDDSGEAGEAGGSGGNGNSNGAVVEEGQLEVYPVTVSGDPLPNYLPDEAEDAAVGMAAPVLEGQDYWGGDASVGGPSDAPTAIYFLAHWCPHCNDEVDEIVALNEEGRLPAGVSITAVSTAVNQDGDNYPPSQWLDRKDWPFGVLADDQGSPGISSYGGSGFPFVVLLDEDGNVIARQSGSTSADQIVEFLEQALA